MGHEQGFNSHPRSNNAKIAAKIRSVASRADDLRKEAAGLAKENSVKWTEILENKLADSRERNKQLTSAVGRLEAANEAITKRTGQDPVWNGAANRFEKSPQ